ncbi:lysylphosphatidylglycerol synthase transmembrane domain-containing protein [Methylomarinovum caldicuralii]|nr:lysylphosphatidylglycerol synthase transmembrane domain-containing protein [Methylomarinovum caldicuralii]
MARNRRLTGLILSVVLAAAGYLAFSLWAGWREVLAVFRQVEGPGLAVLLGLSLTNYLLRFLRWQLYLTALGHRPPVGLSALIYFAGFALTTTPGKAGEMLRGVFLKARGMPYVSSTAAFVSERLSDVVAVALLALAGVGRLYPPGEPLVKYGLAAIAAGLVLLAGAGRLRRWHDKLQRHPGRLLRFGRHLLGLVLDTRQCHHPLLLPPATGLGLLAWFAEGYAFYLLLHWLGYDAIDLVIACAIYALAMLAGAVSFLPGGIGGAEAAMTLLLLWVGVGQADAVAATLLIRLTTLWFAVALGAVALLAGGKALNRPPQPLPQSP